MNTLKKITVILAFGFFTVVNAATTIVVDWALDEEPTSNTHTCTYAQGGLFQPDTSGSGAGKCTFRRALREAGARSDESVCPGCTPITIVFTGLNGTNGDGDDSQFNSAANQWVLPINSASNTSAFELDYQFISDQTGPITISGPTVNVLSGQMPKIMIDSGKTLEVFVEGVTIENMGFMGGMSIQWKADDGTFQNNTWGLSADGMSMVFGDLVGNPDNLAGNHGILGTSNASNLLVQNNIITGASTNAITSSSMTTGVQILNNLIGTRIDGTVPTVPENLDCRTFTQILPVNPPIDNAEWFGGAGILVAGTGAVVQGNTLAGLQSIHSTFSTPPMAIEAFGRLHTIEQNIIGKDKAGNQVGVCGQGIKFSTQHNTVSEGPANNGHMIIDNEIYKARNGFENTTGAILWSDTTVASLLDGGNTVRGNLSIDGPEKYFEIGPLLTTPIRVFEPAQINSISGTSVTGGNNQSNIDDNPSPCPNCIIDFYLDDNDANQEALAHLGSTTASANGNFSFTLTSPLANGFGIRTTSTSVADEIIPHTWAGQTSKMSSQLYGAVLDTIFSNGFD